MYSTMSDAVPLVSEAVDVAFQDPGAEPRPHEIECSSSEQITIRNSSTYPLDFTDHFFRCDPQRAYTFSDFLAHVEPGASVRISGGKKDYGVLQSYPGIYLVGTGLVPPLLDEHGGNFFIRNPDGDVVVAEYYEGK
jgi:hypothetical protein